VVKNTKATSPIRNKVIPFIKAKLLPVRQFFVKNKAPLLLLTGLVVLSAIIYASQNLLFLSPKNREIVGITLFSASGFFLVLDQITKNLAKDKTYKGSEIYKKVKEWLSDIISKGRKNRIKFSLLLLPIFFLAAYIAIFVFQAVSTGEKLAWSAIGGVVFAVLIMSTSYLYMLKHTNRLFDKLGNRWQKFKGTTQNMLYSNIFLFLSSLILISLFVYLSRFIATFPGQLDMSQSIASIIWYFTKILLVLAFWSFAAFFIIPAFMLSLLYFIVLAVVWLIYFFKSGIPRIVFWVVIFMSWITGSILLLMNAIAS
jgi:hypothetical protein